MVDLNFTRRCRFLHFSLRGLFLFALVSTFCSARAGEKDSVAIPPARPMIAIWRRDVGMNYDSESTFIHLRIAIWNDGSVLFAKDPTKWSPDLQQGKISLQRVEQLRKALDDTGVFELKGTCYLVADAPTDCIMIDVGKKKQMLYWDEVESAGYGINIDAKPQHIAFKKCWKMVNHLALLAGPDQAEPVNKRYENPPASWYLKPAIQSE